MHLDNILFLDWFASLAGIYYDQDADTYYRLQLRRGAVLRVTRSIGQQPAPLSVVDVLQRCERYSPLSIAHTRAAATLSHIGRRAGSTRLLLETTLHRRRLYPCWLGWIAARSTGEYNPRDCDRYIVRFASSATFDDLVVLAAAIPWIGPWLMYSLFKTDAGRAAQLFEEWLAAGEHGRFRDLGGHLPMLAADYVGTAVGETLMRVAGVVGVQANVGKADG
ncbi:MAG: hypothetical protein V4558_05695 [Gemmatimonadota bacterium]